MRGSYQSIPVATCTLAVNERTQPRHLSMQRLCRNGILNPGSAALVFGTLYA
jgi:hypothetical protein